MSPLPPDPDNPVLVVESASPELRAAVNEMENRGEVAVVEAPRLPRRNPLTAALMTPIMLAAGMGLPMPFRRRERGKPQSAAESQRQLAAAEAKRQRRADKRAAVEARHTAEAEKRARDDADARRIAEENN